MRRSLIALTLFLMLAATTSIVPGADRSNKEASALLPLPQIKADQQIPTLKKVLDVDWAETITSHAEIERYLQALAAAAPNQTRLVRYGSTYEDRGLYYLVVSSPKNMSRLDEIRTKHLRLADPRGVLDAEAERLCRELPVVVWLAYSIHGNECSPADSALVLAYHLLADRRPETRQWLEQTVVIIDPLQNPDGRERFVHSFRKNHGRFAESHPYGSEHTEPWPGGRTNHYYFDMNRDWFLQSQRETRAKVKAYLDWQPQILVDAHEMGRNANYFFAPPALPINAFVLPNQIRWLSDIGRHHAAWYDRYGFRYTTREMFDAYYPGYGSEWPLFHGAVAILWEQAGVRGLVIDRDDETQLPYAESVLHHYVSALATIELAASRRESLLHDFYKAQKQSIQMGQDGPVQHFFLLEGDQPDRAARLAALLANNRIEVFRLDKPVVVKARETRETDVREWRVPAGSYHVPVAQPSSRLVRALLDREVKMEREFVERQLERNRLFLPDEIYDVTAWSLPLAFGVKCLESGESAAFSERPYDKKPRARVLPNGSPQVAYLVPGTDGAMQALCRWLRAGLRVHVADRAFKLDGRSFDPGTLILFVGDNPKELGEHVRLAAEQFQLAVYGADTGFVDEGAHLGGPYVKWVKPPKILMPIGRPTSYRAGHTWYLFDQRLEYPVTRVRARDLANVDLNDFNVLILPDGSYSERTGFDAGLARRWRDWVSAGGTLVLVDGATLWAMDKDIGLLATQRLQRPISHPETSGTQKQPDADQQKPEMVSPDSAPGVFLRATVFPESWLAYGCGKTLDVFYAGNLILKPMLPTSGRNVVTFANKEELLVSGFCWPETLELLAETPYMTYQSVGRGHIVALTDDPNYRAMYPGIQRLFANAVLFGPGH